MHSLTSLLFFLSVSRPDKVFFPPANWKLTKNHEVEQDVGPAVEHIYEVISHVVSCADSSGLSRLGPKADATVHKESRHPRPKKMSSSSRSVIYLFSGCADPPSWDLTVLHFRWPICRLGKYVKYERKMCCNLPAITKICNDQAAFEVPEYVAYWSFLFSFPFSSWWTTGPVGSATPYLSCAVPSVSRVKLSFTLLSSPLKAPSTAPPTETWTTSASK